MTNAVSSAMPLPAKDTDTSQLASAPDNIRPALTFSPSTKFTAVPVARERSQNSQNDSEDAASDSDDLTNAQVDKARERLYRDKARDAIKKEQVHMEGFLYKKAGGGASKAWNKRWCVLRSQALLIYKRFSEEKLKRIIRVEEIVDVHHIERRNHSFVFEIETPGRSFLFEASSEQELVTWVGRIRAVVAEFNTSNSCGSRTNSMRKSSESYCDARQHSLDKSNDDENSGQLALELGRMQFNTASRVVSTPPPKESIDSPFLSLPSIGIRRSQSTIKAANAIFSTNAEDACGDVSGPCLRIQTPRSTPKLRQQQHGTTSMAQSSADPGDAAMSALPPGINPGHEPAPIVEEDCEEDEEEPNFNVAQRREIENRLFEDRVILRGYLLKQDKLRQWRRRWFVLRQNTLSYYHNDKEYEVKQIIRRHDIHDIRGPDPSSAKARSLHRTYFKLVTDKRSYWLAHDDSTKAREWFATMVRWSEGLAVSPVAIRQSASAQHPVSVAGSGASKIYSASTSPQALSRSQPQPGDSLVNHLGISMPNRQPGADNDNR
ncbi:hypothetical protein GGI15_004838 [Coemansia interrupta]|uniref:PH domain-containing protein n=1 Tax=Coemansia interrupta TaxID=1126814 RepID=A0A9W8H8G7_9FUNG|nr:hypothetical protein GGI15_004838 [Coemansia interrupta]